MTPDPWLMAAAVPAALIAGVAKGGFGGSGAIAAVPILALAMPPAQAAGVMLPLLMLMDAMGFAPWWRRWNWAEARPLMVAATLGTGLGWASVGVASPAVVQLMVGALALLFVGWRLAQRRGSMLRAFGGEGPVSTAAWGIAAGFASFVAHAGGPPATMALMRRDLDKTTFQATMLLVFWWINLVKLPPYLALGLIDGVNLGLSALLAPAAAAGVALGVWAHRRVPQGAFDAVILATLGLSGVKLAADGLAGLG
jgi:uncharacterized membrane protein YfcA